MSQAQDGDTSAWIVSHSSVEKVCKATSSKSRQVADVAPTVTSPS